MRIHRVCGALMMTAALVAAFIGSAARAADCNDGRLRYVTSEFEAQRALIAAGVLDGRVGEGDCETLELALERYDRIYGAPEGATYREKVDKITPLHKALLTALELEETKATGWPLLVPRKYAQEPEKGSERDWSFKFKSEDLLFMYAYRFGIRPNPPSKHLLNSMRRDMGQKVGSLLQTTREFRLENKSGSRAFHRSRQAFVAGRHLYGLYISYPEQPLADFVVPDHLVPLVNAWRTQLAAGDAGASPGRGETLNELGFDADQRTEIAALVQAGAASRTPAVIDEVVRKWVWLRTMNAVALLSGSHLEETNRWKTVPIENCYTKNEDRKVRVLFATNREGTGELGKSKLAETWFRASAHAENALTIGCAVVSTPAYGDAAVNAKAVEARSHEGDKAAQESETKFTAVSSVQLSTPTVDEATQGLRLIDSERRLFEREDKALVYVHGYNTTFEHSLFQAAQIAAATGYKGRVYLFSWPSAGSSIRYLADMDSAERSEPHFTAFLRAILADPALKEIDLVGHSMGSQILTRSLNAVLEEFSVRDRVRLGHVILAAPDISTDVFTAKVQEISRLAKGVTIYASAADWPLWASGFVRSANRLGIIVDGNVPVVPGAKFVTATPIDNACTFWGYGRLGHSYITDEPEVLRHISRVLNRSRYQVDIDMAKGDEAQQLVVKPEKPKCWWRPVPQAERAAEAAAAAAAAAASSGEK